MCFPNGEMDIEILPDGRVRVVTGDMGGPQHMAAEKFMMFLEEQLGGETTVEKRPQGHHHHHHGQKQENRG